MNSEIWNIVASIRTYLTLKYSDAVLGDAAYFCTFESNSVHFLSDCLNKNKTFLRWEAVCSINHSRGAEIPCKVFGDDSWLVGAADREPGFARDVELWHSLSSATYVYVDECFCLCVCVYLGAGEQHGRWQAACGSWGNCYLQLAPQTLQCVCILCVSVQEYTDFAWLYGTWVRQPD